jgi:hypothetical protein
MNNNVIKLTAEEIESLKKLSDSYSRITAEFGQIKIEKILLKAQLSRLEELETSLTVEYLSVQSTEQQLATEIQKKYGDGEVNLETGEFIPVSVNV